MQAVCNIDDDTKIDIGALEFAFQTWKERPLRMLGLFGGTIYRDGGSGLYLVAPGASPSNVSSESYFFWMGKAWMASAALMRLAENDADPLVIRMREFLHDPSHEYKGCECSWKPSFFVFRGTACITFYRLVWVGVWRGGCTLVCTRLSAPGT